MNMASVRHAAWNTPWVVAMLVIAAWLGGCSMKTMYTRTVDLRVPHHGGSGLDVRSRNGSINVAATVPGEGSGAAGSEVGGQGGGGGNEVVIKAVISATSRERAMAAGVAAQRDSSGVLRVRVEWPGGQPESSEGAAFTLRAPEVMGVWAETSNGSIELSNASGAADLDTSNGSIRVNNHAGDVNASSSNGGIEMFDITGAVDASSSNGSIDLIDIRGRVFAETSNGNVLVQLARLGRGPCIIETSNGRADLIVGPGFRGELACDTSNGQIVTDIPHADMRVRERTNVVLSVGTDGGRSRVSTSNGGIRVTYVGEPQIEVPVRSSNPPAVVVRAGLADLAMGGREPVTRTGDVTGVWLTGQARP